MSGPCRAALVLFSSKPLASSFVTLPLIPNETLPWLVPDLVAAYLAVNCIQKQPIQPAALLRGKLAQLIGRNGGDPLKSE